MHSMVVHLPYSGHPLNQQQVLQAWGAPSFDPEGFALVGPREVAPNVGGAWLVTAPMLRHPEHDPQNGG